MFSFLNIFPSDELLAQCLTPNLEDQVICDRGFQGRRKKGRSQQSWRNQVTDFMRIRNMEEDMAEDIRFWRLGMHRHLLVV